LNYYDLLTVLIPNCNLRRSSFLKLQLPAVALDELSMGMTGDFEVAIEEGATLVRIGTAIFGERY